MECVFVVDKWTRNGVMRGGIFVLYATYFAVRSIKASGASDGGLRRVLGRPDRRVQAKPLAF